MPVISTNTAANTALRYLNNNASEQSSALAKLASGSNITKASDGEYKGEMARLSIVGSKGNLEMDGFGDLYLSDRAKGWRLVSTQPPVNPDDPNAAFKEGRMLAFRNQVQAFIDTIHGKSTSLATGRDGRQGLAACLALTLADSCRRWLSIAPGNRLPWSAMFAIVGLSVP